MASSDPPDGEPYDILIVGGGPVGLHAALEGAVLNHRVLLVDKGRRFSRVCQAEHIANVPGCHLGVSGDELLDRGRRALAEFEEETGKHLVTVLEHTEAVDARRNETGDFVVRIRGMNEEDAREVAGRVLILATGVVDRKPHLADFPWRGHETLAPYVEEGDVGYCVLCEGWSVEGKRVAVVGARPASVEIARDLERHFSGTVTLLTDGEPLDGERARARLEDAGVHVDSRPLADIHHAEDHLEVDFKEGERARFDKAFLALGWYKVNNELAVQLGAGTTEEGCVVADDNSEVLDRDGNVIEGLFAVGDVRANRWKQIVIGWGDAETAVITAYAKRLP